MESAHGETGANKNFTLNKEILNFKNVKNIYQLRFILQQPSIYWRDFNIDEIKITKANPVGDAFMQFCDFSFIQF